MRRKKNNADSFYNFWSFAILLSLVIVLFAILFASCGGGNSDVSPAPDADVTDAVVDVIDDTPDDEVTDAPDDTPEPTELIDAEPFDLSERPQENDDSPTVLEESDDMGQDYVDSIVFMGDSTTYGMAYYNVVDTNNVWTPANGTFSLFNQSIITILYPETGEELTIEELLARRQPEYLMITLGVNGVSMMDEDYFKSEYIKLIERVQAASPDTKIIVNSMYPVTSSYTTISNSQISLGNTWLVDVAEQTGTRFLNTSSALANEWGYLPDELTNGDGLHLNPDGFAIIIDYIRTHGYK